jgi:Methyltransferase domain
MILPALSPVLVGKGSNRRMFTIIKKALTRLPPFRGHLDPAVTLQPGGWPPGHYYSPIPSHEQLKAREHVIWGTMPRGLPSIDLNEEGQLALFNEFQTYYEDMPFGDKPRQDLRYYFENNWFSYTDAIVLHCMIRHLKPRRIIEIGSGFSSAVILDTNDLFLAGNIECTFIEPNPDRLQSLLRDSDRKRHRLISTELQDVDLNLFKTLSANDILFVDSSHVAKVHSDVNRIIFDIMPILDNEVSVHFHDVFFPFEYPKDWIYQGIAWNEAYLLRAFLQYNNAYQIQFFNSYLVHSHRELFVSHMPLCLKNPGGSIWLKKI